jgi:hypothetical protein
MVAFNEQAPRNEFPPNLNAIRIEDVQNAISRIGVATSHPELKVIDKERNDVRN